MCLQIINPDDYTIKVATNQVAMGGGDINMGDDGGDGGISADDDDDDVPTKVEEYTTLVGTAPQLVPPAASQAGLQRVIDKRNTLQVEMRCTIRIVDVEGRIDRRGMHNLLEALSPRRVVVVHGPATSTDHLLAFCSARVSTKVRKEGSTARHCGVTSFDSLGHCDTELRPQGTGQP